MRSKRQCQGVGGICLSEFISIRLPSIWFYGQSSCQYWQVASLKEDCGSISIQARAQMEATMDNFLSAVARSLREDGVAVRTITRGSLPVRTIVFTAEEEDVDIILLTSRGRGGFDRIMIGSVAESVV
ncbi:MAG: universal stress protein, partial [Anaerolineales bacterium]|nr:universal stress protein [Anaerolineales bacterium]